jgi:carboxylesterase type B
MIFGESAGAGAVSNHVVMKKSWPYFNNAAMQSGGFQVILQFQAANHLD